MGRNTRLFVIDTIANVSFYTPIGFTIYVLSGVTFEQAMFIGVSSIIMNTIAGRPYGKYLDWVRKKLV